MRGQQRRRWHELLCAPLCALCQCFLQAWSSPDLLRCIPFMTIPYFQPSVTANDGLKQLSHMPLDNVGVHGCDGGPPDRQMLLGPQPAWAAARSLRSASCASPQVSEAACWFPAAGPVGSTGYCGGKCCTGDCNYDSATSETYCCEPADVPLDKHLQSPWIHEQAPLLEIPQQLGLVRAVRTHLI